MRELSAPTTFTVGEHDSIVHSVFAHERDDPDYPIFQRLVDGAWTDVTCAQAAEQIRSAALGLIAESVQPGDRVSIFSATRYEWTILDFAILAVGAVTVPIYETSSAEQVRWVLQDSGAVLVFPETDAHGDKVDQLRSDLPDLRKVLRIAGSETPALDVLAEAGKSVDSKELEARLAAIKSGDPATLIYTSGTTGTPKAAMLTHRNVRYTQAASLRLLPIEARFGADGAGMLVSFLPMAHVTGRHTDHWSSMIHPVTLSYCPDSKQIFTIAAQVHPTTLIAVPRIWEKLYAGLRAAVRTLLWVSLPLGAAILGLGRALGETMAVTMVIGNTPGIAASLFKPGYTLASVIANEFTEATTDIYLQALFEIGLVLFGVTILVNLLAQLFLKTMITTSPTRAVQ